MYCSGLIIIVMATIILFWLVHNNYYEPFSHQHGHHFDLTVYTCGTKSMIECSQCSYCKWSNNECIKK